MSCRLGSRRDARARRIGRCARRPPCLRARRLPAALRTALPADIAAAQRRFGASLRGVSAADRSRAEAMFATGVAAYAYGLPPVLLRLTVQRFPRNQFVGIAQLTDASVRAVVAPNHDTLYSVSQVDLSNGPVVIDAPATGGRYSILQLLDAYTNDFAYAGAGAGATARNQWRSCRPDGRARCRRACAGSKARRAWCGCSGAR